MNIFTKLKESIDKVKKDYYEFKNNGAGKTMLYGRFRRIELVKKIGIIILVVLLLFIVISFVSKRVVAFKDNNTNFEYMKDFFKMNGYSCQSIDKSGGNCFKETENSNVIFTRYDEGFYYLVKTESYEIYFRHIVNTYNDITFTTTDKALTGYKNKTYTCYTDDSIVGNLENCVSLSQDKLDSDTYLGVIKSSIDNLNTIIIKSGYSRDSIVYDYYWKK